ncbi:MAG: universal stress protein [Muribaculum sp.]|nr:universal stress protein [Muribaculum sp.]
MADDRLITLAIHTYDHAVALKNLLESEGVESVLQNVNLQQPVVSSGIRVRIHESDLPQALRIIENTDIFLNPEYSALDYNRLVLLPVDFSEHSLASCDIAFRLASRLKANVILLNSYLDPYFAGNIQLTDAAQYDNEIADTEMKMILEKEARKKMDRLKDDIRMRIKSNDLPAVKFSTEIAEGLPEEVIAEFAKQKKPELIVMGTRGAAKKEKELIGSVTAEVLDSCRFPVFTLPESVKLTKIEEIRHVLFFNNLDQEDILAIDALARTFSKERLEVTLANVPGKKIASTKSQAVFMAYCREHYPSFNYSTAELSLSSITEDFQKIQERHKIDLIVVPNKKKNVFARFFNPSLAHRLLFHSDIPMMVIPV